MSRIAQEPSIYRHHRCPELDRGERLLVRALRRWLRGGSDWERAVRDASRTLKPAQAIVFLNALKGLAETVDAHARRVLRLRTPRCRRVSADERSVVALIGAVQHGRSDHALAILEYLMHPVCHRTALVHALSLARTLEKAGFRLAPPRVQRPPATGTEIGLRAIA